MIRHSTRLHLSRLACLLAAPLVVATHSSSTSACGCFAPPIPQPAEVDFAVNQQSEQIIFEVDGDHVNAHVLIRYSGAPESFGWLVPVPNVPELELSYAGAFGLIDQQTSPITSVSFQDVCPSANYVCRRHPLPSCPGLFAGDPSSAAGGASSGAVGTAGSGSSAEGGLGPGEVMVFAREQIGSYDTVVLGSGDAGAIVTWLNDNDFITNDTMTPYMQPYLDNGMLFVAARLVPGAGVEEIRPLRMRYEGTEPLIPLRLTAVAAEPHLTVTAYIYGDQEYQPIGRPLATVDAEDLSTPFGRLNYPMLLSRTVDDAGGDAFVREYSGAPPRYQDASGGCCSNMAPVSSADGDPDAGVPASTDFCGIGGDGLCQCPFDGFDQSDCADNEELSGTLTLVAELADKHTHVTRLTTRISAEEMTFDPVFEANGETAQPGRMQVLGTQQTIARCRGDVIDTDLLEQQEVLLGCGGIYCGDGECAAAEDGAGCICDAGFVARSFQDLDGRPSVTCVPEGGTIDLAAGGIDVPDVCEPYSSLTNGTCVAVGGVPAMECDEGFVAVDDAAGFVACSQLVEGSGAAGAVDNTDLLSELDICAPAPPACPSWGWLEPLADVPIPGVECDSSIPDPTWLDVPPEPTCEDLTAMTSVGGNGAGGEDSVETIVLTPLAPMDTGNARPAVALPERSADGGVDDGSGGSSSDSRVSRRSGGCAVGRGAPSTFGTSLILGWIALGIGRRRRATRRHRATQPYRLPTS